jgi:hypothetical protein
MTQAIVRRALETALNAYADAQSIPVAWENVEFTQPDTVYLRAFMLPAETTSADIGRVNRRFAGIFQVSIVSPTGTGPATTEAIAAGLSAAFDPAVPLSAGGITVWIVEPLSQGPAIQDRDRFVIPCSLPYAASTY